MLECWWVDAGTHKSLARAKRLLCGAKSSEGGSTMIDGVRTKNTGDACRRTGLAV